jgi:hypothetical protein
MSKAHDAPFRLKTLLIIAKTGRRGGSCVGKGGKGGKGQRPVPALPLRKTHSLQSYGWKREKAFNLKLLKSCGE